MLFPDSIIVASENAERLVTFNFRNPIPLVAGVQKSHRWSAAIGGPQPRTETASLDFNQWYILCNSRNHITQTKRGRK